MSPADAQALMANTLVWDTHAGFMPDPRADLNNLSRWTEAGFDYLSINAGFDLMAWTDVVKTLSSFRRWLAMRPERFVLARTADDVRGAVRDGRLAITFDLEGMVALDGRIEMVQFFHELGVRQMHFAYNRNNAAGGGCHDDDCGLTDFGRAVIDEMNRVGMFVDVSHAGYRTSMEVMDRSSDPVIFSHSNAAVVEPHGRNITDEQARTCAATGGIVGVCGIDLFLGRSAPMAERMADHIDHYVQLIGPAHVGIGLDYGFPVEMEGLETLIADNADCWPVSEGYHDRPIAYLAPGEMAKTIALLAGRGYPEGTLRDILGGNFLRLAERVWRA